MIRAFEVDDIYSLKVQPKQADYLSHIKIIAENNQIGEAYTYTESGEVKAIIGAQEQWKGRVAVWALIGDVTSWARFHKEVSRILKHYAELHNVLRFELTTTVGFDESERWASMLGFKFESLMPCFGVHGEDHKMWVILCQQH